MPDHILAVSNLKVSIRTDEGRAQVLDHVDLRVTRGRIIGLVGESGCGKTSVIRAILGILPREATVEDGEINLEGENLLTLDERTMSYRIRGKAISFVPQDPYQSLNPVFRVGDQLLEIMRWHFSEEVHTSPRLDVDPSAQPRRSRKAKHRHYRDHLIEMLQAVQIPDPEEALRRYPHQFSGGQRQRLLIAGALVCRPRLVIADEPTTALDVTTQLQILALLRRLVCEFGTSMLFITHDFGVVAQLCDEVVVMYAGQSVESGPTPGIINAARHPYTQALIQCHPDRLSSGLHGIPGTVPSPLNPPSGCRFHPRCPHTIDLCRLRVPDETIEETGRTVRCVLYNSIHMGQARTCG